MSYRVEVKIDRVKNNEIGPIVLEHDDKWEGEVSFVPQTAGENQRVEFLLYMNEGSESYLKPLHLWVNVTK